MTYQGVIEGGNQDELAIRGELGEGHSGGLVIDEHLQARPGIGIPDLARPIVAGRHDDGAVPDEVNGGHGLVVRLDRLDALAALDVPDPHSLVEGTGRDAVRRRVEVGAEDEGDVAAEGPDAAVGGLVDVPHAEGAVVRGGADVVGVGGPGEVGDALGVAGEGRDGTECVGGPHDDCLVERRRRQIEAIVGELDARDGTPVVGQRA